MEKKIIKGFDNYVVYSNGDIYNTLTGNKLKPAIKKHGYAEVTLFSNKIRKYKLVHRIVAEAFCKKQENGYEVNHIDGNKLNNNYKNLEWVSHDENLKHAFNSGLRVQDVSAKKIVAIDMVTGAKTIYSSIYKAARAVGASQGNICMCCQGKRPYANGFYWKYE